MKLRITEAAEASETVAREDAVVIVRVVHGARDVAALAERGGFGGKA